MHRPKFLFIFQTQTDVPLRPPATYPLYSFALRAISLNLWFCCVDLQRQSRNRVDKHCRDGQVTNDNMRITPCLPKSTNADFRYVIQGDSFGTGPKKMRISQRLFIRLWTCIYDYIPCFMRSMSILVCSSLTSWRHRDNDWLLAPCRAQPCHCVVR